MGQQAAIGQRCLSLRLLFSSTSANGGGARAGKQQTQSQGALPHRFLLHHRRRCSDNHSRPTMDVRTATTSGAAGSSPTLLATARVPARAQTAVAHVLDIVQTHQGPAAPPCCCTIVAAVRTTIVGRLWMSEHGRRWGSKQLANGCRMLSVVFQHESRVRHRRSRSCWKTTDASSPVGELLAAPSCRCSESKEADMVVRQGESRSCTMGQCCLSLHVSQCATAVSRSCLENNRRIPPVGELPAAPWCRSSGRSPAVGCDLLFSSTSANGGGSTAMVQCCLQHCPCRTAALSPFALVLENNRRIPPAGDLPAAPSCRCSE